MLELGETLYVGSTPEQSMIHDWWSGLYAERYWLEVTGRDDLGANLKAPQGNEQGTEFWSYSLLKYVSPGDVVFHYDRGQQAIVARSIAIGDVWEDEVVWAARGTSARTAGIRPHTRAGWYVGLEEFMLLPQPVTLDAIRAVYSDLLSHRNQLARRVSEPLYFPFELGTKRPMRPMQGYLFKLPAFFVEQLPQLQQRNASPLIREDRGQPESVYRTTDESASEEQLGNDYRIADEATSVGQRDPFAVDPALVERALRSHASTQNALATYLRDRGLAPRSPAANEPNFDLAWVWNSKIWVAEIKSLTEANEEKQLRLGLGQLLRYRQILGARGSIHAALVVERQPRDTSWVTLCEELGIVLVWPGNWHEKLTV